MVEGVVDKVETQLKSWSLQIDDMAARTQVPASRPDSMP